MIDAVCTSICIHHPWAAAFTIVLAVGTVRGWRSALP
jgi:hypothetical protein